MTVFVLPLRAVAVSCALALGWLICFITVFGLSPEQLKQPLTGWRRLCHNFFRANQIFGEFETNKTGTYQVDTLLEAQKRKDFTICSGFFNEAFTNDMGLSCSENASKLRILRARPDGSASFNLDLLLSKMQYSSDIASKNWI